MQAHGKGRAIYLPWLPEWHYHRDSLPDHRDLLTGLATRFAAPPVTLDGAGPVEVTLQRQTGSGRLLVHIVNYSGQRNNLYEEPVALHGLRLGVRGARGQARALVAGVDIDCVPAENDGVAWMELPSVGAFEVVSIAAD